MHIYTQQTMNKLCSRCKDCPGYEMHPVKSNLCQNCGHSSQQHTIEAAAVVAVSAMVTNNQQQDSTSMTSSASTLPAIMNG